MRKTAVTALFVLLIFIQGTASASASVDTSQSGLYSLVNAGAYDQFTNHVGGYTLFVDKDMDIDMSYAPLRTVMENNDKRIEIYKQNISVVGKSAYINYSNKFLENWIDHQFEYSSHDTIGGYDVTVMAWSRNKLSGIENDKNHYVCLELGFGNFVYTIFIKANAPVYDLGGYTYLVENFRIAPVTQAAYIKPTRPVNVNARGWNDETKEFYNTYFNGDSSLTWGIFEPDTALFEYGKLKSYESYLEYEFPIILNYSEFQNNYKHPNLKQRLEMAYNNGKTLELTLQTSASESGNLVYKILNGEYDPFLRDYAKIISDFGHPVLFRLGNEMNGDWCPYSAYNTSKDTEIFKEFYKYVYKFFERAGAAQNVIWVWNPNGTSFPDFDWNNELMYYPGDEYVDVVGMTAYNTGTYYSGSGEKWREFYELYNDMYHRYCANYGQPLMITEVASASMGGDKEQWVLNMFEDIERYDRIKVAIWWDGCDWDEYGNVARSYFIDDIPGLLEIFKNNLRFDWRKGVFG